LERIEKLETSARIKEQEEAKKAEDLEKRRAAFQHLVEIQAENAIIVDDMKLHIMEAEEAIKAAEEEYKAQRYNLNELRRQKMLKGQAYERKMNEHKELLYTTYDPAIDEAITFFHEKLDALRSMKESYQTFVKGYNIFKMKKEVGAYTNEQAILRSIRYCQEAIEALEGSKIIPELDPDIIEELKSNIPDPHELEEIGGEKDIPDPGRPVPRAIREAEENLFEYEIAKIDERIEKLRRENYKKTHKNSNAQAAVTPARPKATIRKKSPQNYIANYLPKTVKAARQMLRDI
jgi:hypothetical protein